jgi:hypothetical protein
MRVEFFLTDLISQVDCSFFGFQTKHKQSFLDIIKLYNLSAVLTKYFCFINILSKTDMKLLVALAILRSVFPKLFPAADRTSSTWKGFKAVEEGSAIRM